MPKKRYTAEEIVAKLRQVDILLGQGKQRLFERQEPRQKRRLLNFLLSNCSWADGELIATFRQPFDLLAATTAIAAREEAVTMAN